MNETILREIRQCCSEFMQESDLAGKYPDKAAASIFESGVLHSYVGGDTLRYADILISAITPFKPADFESMAEKILNLNIEGISNCIILEAPHMTDNTASTVKYEMTVRFSYYESNL